MAAELQRMFSKAEDPVHWSSQTHHVQCYAHKLNLVVGHGLKALGHKVGNAKPSTPHGVPLPIPGLEINDGEDNIEFHASDTESEDEEGLPQKADGFDDEDATQDEETESPCDKDDFVAAALQKVSIPLQNSFQCLSLISILFVFYIG